VRHAVPNSDIAELTARTSLMHVRTLPERSEIIAPDLPGPINTVPPTANGRLALPVYEDTTPSSIETSPIPTARPVSNPSSASSQSGLSQTTTTARPHRFGDVPLIEQAPTPSPYPDMDKVYVYERNVGYVGMPPNVNQAASTSAEHVTNGVNGVNGRSNSNSRMSDTASDRSAGTNESARSNGARFFQNYAGRQVAAGSASSVDATGMGPRGGQNMAGPLTPDLVFAEIGHGRGVGACKLEATVSNETVRPKMNTFPVFENSSNAVASSSGTTSAAMRNRNERERYSELQHDPSSPIPYLSSSPRTRELQESVHSAFSRSSSTSGPMMSSGHAHRDSGPALPVPNSSLAHPSHPHPHTQVHTPADERGRSMRRSLKNTLNAAEHYASSFFFGRSGSAPSGSGSSTAGSNVTAEDVGRDASGSRRR
jgi:F-box and leucine-rich repeat protein GRR1